MEGTLLGAIKLFSSTTLRGKILLVLIILISIVLAQKVWSISVSDLVETPDPVDQNEVIELNATVTSGSSINEVLIQINFSNGTLVNYSAALNSGKYFSRNASTALVGQHNIRWFANDSVGDVNNTELSVFTVASVGTTESTGALFIPAQVKRSWPLNSSFSSNSSEPLFRVNGSVGINIGNFVMKWHPENLSYQHCLYEWRTLEGNAHLEYIDSGTLTNRICVANLSIENKNNFGISFTQFNLGQFFINNTAGYSKPYLLEYNVSNIAILMNYTGSVTIPANSLVSYGIAFKPRLLAYDYFDLNISASIGVTNYAFVIPAPFVDIVGLAPANGTNITNVTQGEIFNVTLQATIGGNTTDNKDIFIFAGNTSTPETRDGLIYQTFNQANGTAVSYNFTALPVNSSSDGLILLWHLDNRSDFGESAAQNGTVYDFSNGVENGTVTGTANFHDTNDCKFGGCFSGDGGTSGDMVTTGEVTAIQSALGAVTVGAWARFNVSDDTNADRIFSKDHGSAESFALQSGDGSSDDDMFMKFRIDGGSNTITWTGWTSNTNWNYWAMSFDNTTSGGIAKLYYNGENVMNGTSLGAQISYNGNNFTILGKSSESNKFFEGYVDETAIWNRTLSPTEIKDIYRLRAADYFWYVNASNVTSGDSSISEIRCLSSDGGCPVFVDTTPPNVTALTETPDPLPIKTTIELNATVLDVSTIDIVRVQVTFPNGTETNYSTTLNNGRYFNASVGSASNGSHTALWFANDTENNVNVTESSTFFVAWPPEADLTFPANGTNYLNDTFNISLNATILDHDLNNTDVFIFASNVTGDGAINATKDGLIYKSSGNGNNTRVTYNITALPVNSSSNKLVLLMHLDNRSDYGEDDGASGLIYDFSDALNNGTINGNPTWNSTEEGCKFGGCFDFDGIDDFINISNNKNGFTIRDNLSIALWAYVPEAQSDNNLFGRANSTSNGYELVTVTSGNRWRWRVRYTTASLLTSETSMTTGVWAHVVGVANDTAVSIYVNGNLQNYTTVSSSDTIASTNGQDVRVGNDPGAAGNEFNGSIDEVAVWNRSLTSVEIKDLYRLRVGNYTWYVNASDQSFTNMSEIRTFEVAPLGGGDSTAPAVTTLTETPDPVGIGQTIGLNATVTDGGTIDTVRVQITYPNGTETNYTASLNNSRYFNRSVSTASNGSHTALWFANDSVNNVNVTESSTFFVAWPPEANLDNPPNQTNYLLDIFNITLNATILDHDLNNTEVFIFAGNSTTPETTNGLIWKSLGNGNNSKIGYNITALPINTTNVTANKLALLMHFDNRSEFGENQTYVYDFARGVNNGTVGGAAIWNDTSEGCKFGGCFDFDGVNDLVTITDPSDTSLDFGTHSFSVSVWAYLVNYTNEGWIGIVDKHSSLGCYQTIAGYSMCVTGGGSDEIGNRNLRVAIGNGTTVVTKGSTDLLEVIGLERWHHFVMVVDRTAQEMSMYIDGSVDGSPASVSTVGSISNADDLLIGKDLRYWNGSLDDVAIYNRTLSAIEIKDIYRLRADNYYWYVNASDQSFTNQSEIRNFIVNNPNPKVVTVSILPASPNTTDQLNCSYTITDTTVPTSLSVNITWRNGSNVYSSVNTSFVSGVVNSTLLTSGVQFKSEVWNCSVTGFDGLQTGINSTTKTIGNSPPNIVTLLEPSNNTDTTDRTPYFNWSATTDIDGDALNYTLNLDCIGGCASDDREANTTLINHTISPDLKFFDDDNDYYRWFVRAYDGTDYGPSSEIRTLNISALVDISLDADDMDFGPMSQGASNDTTDDKPPPFNINNDGNAVIDVNISGTSLFTAVTPPTLNFQYKVDNKSGEQTNAFNWSGSVTVFANISTSQLNMLRQFNHTNGNDSAEVDIAIVLPGDEAAGNKSADLTFTGFYTGGGG